jgi:tRNA 2-thiouridine synthesizing protein B
MLHIISTSPFQNTALQECRKIAQAGDALVLLTDAVYAALTDEKLFSGLQIFALADHMDARGIAAPDWITCIDHDQMVALTCQHHPVHTWC